MRNHRNSEQPADERVSLVAATIAEPARTRMLYSLLDGHARTSTELAVIAEVSASTASVHLQKLLDQRLVSVAAQGKHRYYSLEGPRVARALESLSVIAGDAGRAAKFVPGTPNRLRAARTCYDHLAGRLSVLLLDRTKALGWFAERANNGHVAYDLTPQGTKALQAIGINVAAMRALRRRFAFACLDWSERRPHIGGALGAALLNFALEKKWVLRDLDSRALEITSRGRREMLSRFGIALDI